MTGKLTGKGAEEPVKPLPDNHFLQAPHVPVEVLLMVPQIENGVRHKLTRRVGCDLPAPLCPEQGGRGLSWVEPEVLQSAAASEGEDRGVL